MEYKFRGFDVIGEKWVYGDLVHNKKVTKTGLEPRTMVGGYEVAPESVGVYIGKKDDFGERLFEGDICTIYCYGRAFNAVVAYLETKACFGFKSGSLFTPVDFVTTCKKIGTMYQNKELLDE